MSFFKPKLLPLCAGFFGTFAISAIYASVNSNADTGTYQAAKSTSLAFFWSSFDSLVKRDGGFLYNAFCGAYQTSGLLAFCKWHETGSKIALLWGAVTLISQARWAYEGAIKSNKSETIYTKPKDEPHPPTGNPPPYQAPTAQIDAALPSAPPAGDYGVYTDPNNVVSYPATTTSAPGNYDQFTRNSANSVGSGWSH